MERARAWISFSFKFICRLGRLFHGFPLSVLLSTTGWRHKMFKTQVSELFHCKVLNILWCHPLSIRVMENHVRFAKFLKLWYDVISGKLPIHRGYYTGSCVIRLDIFTSRAVFWRAVGESKYKQTSFSLSLRPDKTRNKLSARAQNLYSYLYCKITSCVITYHIDHDRNYYDKNTWYMLDNVLIHSQHLRKWLCLSKQLYINR